MFNKCVRKPRHPVKHRVTGFLMVYGQHSWINSGKKCILPAGYLQDIRSETLFIEGGTRVQGNRLLRRKLFIMVLSSILFVTSCSTSDNPEHVQIQQVPKTTVIPSSIQVGEQITMADVPVRVSAEGQAWVPLREAVESLDYTYEWEAETAVFQMGFTDVLYSVTMNSTEATAEENTVQLPSPPQLINDVPFMSTASLSTLWGIRVTWNKQENKIIIAARDDFDKDIDQEQADPEEGTGVLALRDINQGALLRYAYQFRGVPYRFGAAPYPHSRRFDCSSFTQYVFKRYGVSLPRTSRNQAKMGYRVSLNNLNSGDLLFFYVPGRYQTNRIVGHVGIYIGSGRILHTYGEGGVKVDTLTSYWKRTFLFARRVAR